VSLLNSSKLGGTYHGSAEGVRMAQEQSKHRRQDVSTVRTAQEDAHMVQEQ
jgi:hypothetical protein